MSILAAFDLTFWLSAALGVCIGLVLFLIVYIVTGGHK